MRIRTIYKQLNVFHLHDLTFKKEEKMNSSKQ